MVASLFGLYFRSEATSPQIPFVPSPGSPSGNFMRMGGSDSRLKGGGVPHSSCIPKALSHPSGRAFHPGRLHARHGVLDPRQTQPAITSAPASALLGTVGVSIVDGAAEDRFEGIFMKKLGAIIGENCLEFMTVGARGTAKSVNGGDHGGLGNRWQAYIERLWGSVGLRQ